MCLVCEGQLFYEHKQLLLHPNDEKCPECHKFLANDGGDCYHCFAVGNTIDECPECAGKAWSPEVLEIESDGAAEA